MASQYEQIFFSGKNIERRKKIREQLETSAQELQVKSDIAEELRVSDKTLIDRIHSLGFTGDSVRVFDLLPLIHVAWADGKIQSQERAEIYRLLVARGISEESDAFVLIACLLEERPSEVFFEQSLELLKDMLKSTGGDAESIVDLCVGIAEAAGGLLGLGNKVASEERQLIEHITKTLGDMAGLKIKKQFTDAK